MCLFVYISGFCRDVCAPYSHSVTVKFLLRWKLYTCRNTSFAHTRLCRLLGGGWYIFTTVSF